MSSLKEKFIQAFEKFKAMKFWKKVVVAAAMLAVIFLLILAFGFTPKEAAVLTGLILAMIIRGDASVLAWRAAGKSFWQTSIVMMIIATIGLIFTYFIIGETKKVLTRPAVKSRWQQTRIWKLFSRWQEFFRKKQKVWQKKIINYLENRSSVFVFLFNLIPLPILPTAVIILSKMREIKYGFLALLISNLIRVYITCWCIWQGINLFKLLFS